MARRIARWRRRAEGAAVLALLLMCLLPAVVGANGVPVDIFLSYLPNVSNWGPQIALGKANVAVADGHIVLDVQRLPRLQDEHYTIWLESRAERKLYRVGTFNVADNGSGHYESVLDVPNQEYRMLLLTVDKDGGPERAPSLAATPAATASAAGGNRRSLAGLFPNKTATPTPGFAAAVSPAAAGAPSAGPGAATAGPTASPARPPYLPVTGTHRATVAALLALVPILVAVVVVGRLRIARLRSISHS